MQDDQASDYHRMPGLYPLWDVPLILQREDDWQIHYAELTQDGTPLFAIYRRKAGEMAP